MSAPVPVILIHLNEYMKLLALNDKIKKQEEEITQHLKTSLPETAHQEESTLSQTGSGQSDGNQDFMQNIRLLTDIITKNIQTQFQLVPNLSLPSLNEQVC
jgi:hypothetical protein